MAGLATLSPSGGATFRTYLRDQDLWYMLWMMAGIEGLSELHARRAGDEVRTSGKGKDDSVSRKQVRRVTFCGVCMLGTHRPAWASAWPWSVD